MNLSPTCEAQLGEAWTRLSRLGQLAAHRGERVALVGGVVRDLLLNEAPSGDFDLAVEGDAIGLAQAWSDKEGGTLHKHQPFQNASWSLHGTQFDLVRARREHYPGVAQLPEVSPASLEDDLGRRDFRLNAMAIDLDPAHLGTLIDPYNGLSDLGERKLEVFHPKSFSDDPTRILRAVRYCTRLNLKLGDSCWESLEGARQTDALETLSLERYGRELHRLLSEFAAAAAIVSAAELGVFDRLPIELFSLTTSAEDCAQAYRNWRGEAVDQAELLWLLLADQIEKPEDWIRLIPEGGEPAKRFGRGTGAIREALAVCESTEDSGTHGEALEGLDPVQRAFATFLSPGNPALHWWEETGRFIRFQIDGAALLEAGSTPGPALGAALKRAKRAAWRGATRDEQLLAALSKNSL